MGCSLLLTTLSQLISRQHASCLTAAAPALVQIPGPEAGKEAVVAAAAANAGAQIAEDRKTTALKGLQVGCNTVNSRHVLSSLEPCALACKPTLRTVPR